MQQGTGQPDTLLLRQQQRERVLQGIREYRARAYAMRQQARREMAQISDHACTAHPAWFKNCNPLHPFTPGRLLPRAGICHTSQTRMDSGTAVRADCRGFSGRACACRRANRGHLPQPGRAHACGTPWEHKPRCPYIQVGWKGKE
eukprot:142572-Pelagomonas_calceolata.AAC.2